MELHKIYGNLLLVPARINNTQLISPCLVGRMEHLPLTITASPKDLKVKWDFRDTLDVSWLILEVEFRGHRIDLWDEGYFVKDGWFEIVLPNDNTGAFIPQSATDL